MSQENKDMAFRIIALVSAPLLFDLLCKALEIPEFKALAQTALDTVKNYGNRGN